ncbi:uncharacterized protein LOC112603993 [Melanaphis sacchari]|uniref:uncharacterized protein LOC112603993 n=1 Tax=Melanaphis sacchari TaxID=742174 RepID=UPI000DC13000|nr:uncharacterized protein LOC112603993 [Melanaphis sacchari]XP_025208626.1 uncharacterized protein LOC112603993 [Melanaphis sacchari]
MAVVDDDHNYHLIEDFVRLDHLASSSSSSSLSSQSGVCVILNKEADGRVRVILRNADCFKYFNFTKDTANLSKVELKKEMTDINECIKSINQLVSNPLKSHASDVQMLLSGCKN